MTHSTGDGPRLHMGLPLSNGKVAMWFFLVTEIMFFTGLIGMYLIVRNDLGWLTVLAVAIVAATTHVVARVVPGVGIVVPTFVPPLAAAVTAWVLDVEATAALAYVAGTLGTLLGADLLNLPRVRELDAPVVSIGGAGTFDGIFVTGIVAVLLAAV